MFIMCSEIEKIMKSFILQLVQEKASNIWI